jgi:hypothetical protein
VLLVDAGRASRDRPQARGGSYGRSGQRQIPASPAAGERVIADGMTAIEQATSTRPAGYNNYWIRPA